MPGRLAILRHVPQLEQSECKFFSSESVRKPIHSLRNHTAPVRTALLSQQKTTHNLAAAAHLPPQKQDLRKPAAMTMRVSLLAAAALCAMLFACAANAASAQNGVLGSSFFPCLMSARGRLQSLFIHPSACWGPGMHVQGCKCGCACAVRPRNCFEAHVRSPYDAAHLLGAPAVLVRRCK